MPGGFKNSPQISGFSPYREVEAIQMINGEFEVWAGKTFYVIRGPNVYRRIPVLSR